MLVDFNSTNWDRVNITNVTSTSYSYTNLPTPILGQYGILVGIKTTNSDGAISFVKYNLSTDDDNTSNKNERNITGRSDIIDNNTSIFTTINITQN